MYYMIKWRNVPLKDNRAPRSADPHHSGLLGRNREAISMTNENSYNDPRLFP